VGAAETMICQQSSVLSIRLAVLWDKNLTSNLVASVLSEPRTSNGSVFHKKHPETQGKTIPLLELEGCTHQSLLQ